MATPTRQRWRRATQTGFYVLFLLAPAFDLLRFDVVEMQLWFLGMRWSLGIDALAHGQVSAFDAGLSMYLRGILPVVGLVAAFLYVAYRWGRLYCGWLCPHFSMVELLNDLLQRASGKLSFWDKHPTPRADLTPNKRWYPAFFVAAVLTGLVWSVTLLTYLLPPNVIWFNLLHAELTPNQARFIGIGTLVFAAEFTFARHLFCRFGCAVGYLQSVAWMGNDRGMVVAFDRPRARDCKECDPPRGSACDYACPMHLNPRNIKRMMFTCVQCAKCLDACSQSQSTRQRPPILEWKVDAAALRETLHARQQERKLERKERT